MIQHKNMNLNTLIKSDYYRCYGENRNLIYIYLFGIVAINHGFSYCFWLRLSSRKNPFWLIAKFMHRRLSRKYGINIPSKLPIGYGLLLLHGHGIIINPTAVIGNNVTICQFTTIGSMHANAATIGDNVYIGPSVSIVEGIKIGNNVTIGAGAVVVKECPENATVAGVPAKVISMNKPARYIGNPWPANS